MDEIILLMYEELKNKLQNDKKIYKDSILLSFLNIKSNTRLQYLIDTAHDSSDFNGNTNSYLENRFIKYSGMEDKYCITAKAIWEIENKALIEKGILVDFLEEKYFYCPSEEIEMTEKERIILLSMILGRVFSPEFQMDLKIEDSHINRWQEIIFVAYDLLKELGCVKTLSKVDLFGKKGNEHAVSNLIRHTDSLPKKCNMIFKATGQQKYHLDLCKPGELEIDREKLKYLLGLIFIRSKRLSLKETDHLASVCIKTAHETGIYTNNIINPFITLKYDNLIKDCFEEI